MRKTFILDTSVLLYDSNSIHNFNGNDIVIPLPVLEELDKKKIISELRKEFRKQKRQITLTQTSNYPSKSIKLP